MIGRRGMRARWTAACIGVAMVAGGCGGSDATAVVPVASLRFETSVANIVAGTAQTIRVELLGADGARASGARDQVVLTVSDGSTFSGPSTVQASNGLAVFTAVALTHAAPNLSLVATSGGKTASTAPFIVSPGPASAAASTAEPATGVVAPTDPTSVVVTIADAYGNRIAGAATKLGAPVGAAFTPDTGTTGVNGTFTTKFSASVGGSLAVTATINTVTFTFGAPISVCANPTLTVPGSISGALTTNSCLASGRVSAFYRFTLAQAGGVAFTVNTGFSPRLSVTADPPLANVFASPNQGLPVQWLLPAGTYELRLSATSGTGSYTGTAALTPGNTGCINRYLAATGVYGGQALATGDCDYGDGTFVDKYVVYSPNPCSFRLHSTTFTNFIFLMELGTGHYLDGRGGDAFGVDALFGMPSCSYIGNPVEIWVLPDEGEVGGAYTLTYTLFPLPGVRAGGVTMPLSHERAPIDPRVLKRLRTMAAALRR